MLITLSQTIEKKKKIYYHNLEISNKSCDLTSWILYFSKTILEAQVDTLNLVNFIVQKSKFYDKHKNHLNDRQRKVVSRILQEGLDGFAGGLSASNYITIAKTSSSTATRDLQDLVSKKIFKSRGANKFTRYYLNLVL